MPQMSAKRRLLPWRKMVTLSCVTVALGALVGCFAPNPGAINYFAGLGKEDSLANDPNRPREDRGDPNATPGTERERAITYRALPADPTSQSPKSYYEGQLVELPLRIKSYDLNGPRQNTPVVIREMHVVHDDVRDEILIIDDEYGRNHLWSLDAYDFTLHWRALIEQRVDYAPLPTQRYIHLLNSDGEYQGYDRMSSPRAGESRLVSKGRFEGNIFPSAPAASNDTHVFVPATNSNSMRGMTMLSNARGEGAETWTFPRVGARIFEQFLQISTQPAADGETVAFVNNNGYLYVVDAQTGEFRSSADLGGHSRTMPTLKDDLVFVGSDMGQIFAWEKSGDSAWIVTIDGLPYGEIFVEDRWVFVRTLDVYDEIRTTDDGERALRAAVRPGKLMAFKYKVIDIESDRPVYDVVDGDPSTPYRADPMWTEPDVGQEVLMVHGDRVYILYEDREEFLTERQKADLRSAGRIVSRDDELITVSRRLRVLDLNTGRLARPEWDINLMDFDFVEGSMEERDRAIYLGTKDGFIFKLYGKSGSAGGN